MTKMSYGLVIVTAASILRVEDWLTDNCQGDWEVRLLDLEDATKRKKVQILFEQELDKNNFKAAYTAGKTHP